MDAGGNIAWKKAGVTAAFTRTDLFVTVGVVCLLGMLVWAGIAVAGEKRRIFFCASHLKTLGRTFAEYAHEHQDALPPAVVSDGTNSTSWDREIAAYLDGRWDKRKSLEQQKAEAAKIAPAFKCPSDREPRGGADARSYSMPMYDLKKAGWPPDEQSLEGVGLYWDVQSSKKIMGADNAGGKWPAIKTSMVKAPADTALLVERISILNALWATKYACIVSVREQFDAKTFAARDFHGGKMNYLFLDGHVELLWPAQSGGHLGTGDQGLWTIRPGD